MSRDRILTYPALRAIVIALHNQGLMMKAPGLTFSHGNVGNEYLAIASDIDDLVSELERNSEIILRDKARDDREDLSRKNLGAGLAGTQQVLDQIKLELGVSGLHEGAVFVRIEELLNCERQVLAPVLKAIKKGKKCTTHK